MKNWKPLKGKPKGNTERDISSKTAQRAGYYTTTVPEDYPNPKIAGQEVEFWSAWKDGEIVGQKCRIVGTKNFVILGDGRNLGTGLAFAHEAPEGGKLLVITEGEYDALSYMECRENWPAVSLPNGATSARKVLEANLPFLESFDKVVLQFDNDAPGRKAMEDCAGVLSPGKLHFGSLPRDHKDYNDAWRAGDTKAILHSVFQAEKIKLQGLVEVEDVIHRLAEPIELGLPWFLADLTRYTYGRYLGSIIGLGAGTGVGKTDFLTEQIRYDVVELGEEVCTIFLEQKPEETVQHLASKHASKLFEPAFPGEEPNYSPEEVTEAAKPFLGMVHMYDSFGQTDWDDVKTFIRQVAAGGCRIFYLDHLTALADTSDEKGSLEKIMKELAGLANELNIIIIYVSHLTTPDGKPHEEGGRVMIRHFKGSRSIGFWSFVMIGLERDQQAEDDEERRTTTIRMLKIRKRGAGRNTGKTTQVVYDTETGRLNPTAHVFETAADEGAF